MINCLQRVKTEGLFKGQSGAGNPHSSCCFRIPYRRMNVTVVVDGSGGGPTSDQLRQTSRINTLPSQQTLQDWLPSFSQQAVPAAQRCPLLSSELLPSGTTNTTAVSNCAALQTSQLPLFGLFNAAMGVATIIRKWINQAGTNREHHHPHPGLGGHSVVRLTGLMGNGWEVL